jgi:hypothetical protein
MHGEGTLGGCESRRGEDFGKGEMIANRPDAADEATVTVSVPAVMSRRRN